jgi:hypothetical protein
VQYFNNFNEATNLKGRLPTMNEQAKKLHPVTVYVNNNPVDLPDRETTGAQILAQAKLPVDFQLFREHGKGKLDQIDDLDAPLKAKDGERFRAVSGQDVS